MTDPDPWRDLLDPDEVLLWQGKPEPGVKLEWESPFETIPLLFMIGFPIFWMSGASKANIGAWMFGLLFLGAGLFGLFGIHFWKAYTRRNQHYALTNKRAFIGAQKFGKRTLESYPITAETTLKYEDGNLSSIWFAEKLADGNIRKSVQNVGFERLSNGREVLAKFREVQNANAKHSQK